MCLWVHLQKEDMPNSAIWTCFMKNQLVPMLGRTWTLLRGTSFSALPIEDPSLWVLPLGDPCSPWLAVRGMAVHLPQAQMEHTYIQHIPHYLCEKWNKKNCLLPYTYLLHLVGLGEELKKGVNIITARDKLWLQKCEIVFCRRKTTPWIRC